MKNVLQTGTPAELLTDGSVSAGFGKDGELDLFDFVLVLRARLRRTILFAVAGGLAAALLSFVVKPRFDATASALIPKPALNPMRLALQAATGGVDLGGGGNGQVYTDILKSRTVSDSLINQFHLVSHYGVKERTQAQAALKSSSTIVASTDGLLKVTVRDWDPKLAADLANGYLRQLDELNQRLAITSASQERRYYEQQMIKEKNALEDAEVVLQQSQEKSGVLQPQLQAAAQLGASEGTRAQLRELQVQLGVLLKQETPQNPEVIRLEAQISRMEAQLKVMQSGGGAGAGIPSAKLPADMLAYLRAAREVKFHERLFELLSGSYESAKQQEAKDVSLIQLLDDATPPPHKAWPPRMLVTVGGIVLGLIIGMLFTAFQAFARTVMRNPQNQQRYDAIKSGQPLLIATPKERL